MKETENIFGQELTAITQPIPGRGETGHGKSSLDRFFVMMPIHPEARTFADYVGTYELARGKTLTVSREGGQLLRQRGDGPKVELIPEVTGVFFRERVEGRILLPRGTQGKVEALLDHRNSQERCGESSPVFRNEMMSR